MVSEQPTRVVVRRLRDAGYIPIRTVRSHTVWMNDKVTVSIPDGHRTISPGVVRRVDKAIREART